MTNPFVKPPSVDRRIMPARTALIPGGGVPAGEALNNWMPEELTDGALCYVLNESDLYVFRKFSTAAPSASVITTSKGVGVPGRWFAYNAAAASKAFMALSYAKPNASGDQPIAAQPGSPAIYTDFDGSIDALVLASSGDLSFDGLHSIVADRAMTVKIDWFMSYYITAGGYYYGASVMLDQTTIVPGGNVVTYYSPEAVSNRNMNIGANTIATVAEDATLSLRVAIFGSATNANFVMEQGVLVVTEL
jgi:hypothetical protein